LGRRRGLTPAEEFLSGIVAVGDHRVTLSKDTIGELVEGLQFFSLMHPEEDLV